MSQPEAMSDVRSARPQVDSNRPTISTYDEITLAFNQIQRYTNNRADAFSIMVRNYVVDLDLLSKFLAASE